MRPTPLRSRDELRPALDLSLRGGSGEIRDRQVRGGQSVRLESVYASLQLQHQQVSRGLRQVSICIFIHGIYMRIFFFKDV